MISVSQLCSYIYCKRKFFINYVLGVRLELPKSVAIGTVRHEVYNLINREEQRIVSSIIRPMTVEEIYEIYKKAHLNMLRKAIVIHKTDLKKRGVELSKVFEEIWPGLMKETLLRAGRLYDFIKANEVYGTDLWEMLEPKVKAEISINSKELGLKGKIDELEFFKDGCVPVELKTGKCPEEGVWLNHKIQVAAYCMLVEKQFNCRVNSGIVYYLDYGVRRTVVMNSYLRSEVKELIQKIKLSLNSKEIPRLKITNKCDNCELRQICHNKVSIDKLMEKITSKQ